MDIPLTFSDLFWIILALVLLFSWLRQVHVQRSRTKLIRRIDDETLIRDDMARKALDQMRAEVVELLEGRMPAERAMALAERLSQGRWTHDHPIGFRQAQELGLTLNREVPSEFYELMKLFPQPVRRRPSVQYVPVPYGPPEQQDKDKEKS